MTRTRSAPVRDARDPARAPLNVGVVVTSPEWGGAEAHIARIWTEPGVAAYARPHLLGHVPRWSELGFPETDLGLPAKWSYRRSVRSVAGMPRLLRRGTRTITATHRREPFDVFYAHFKREQVLFTRSLARLAPVIWMEHGHFPGGPLRRPLEEAYRRAARHAAAIICISASVRDEIGGIVGPRGPAPVVIENAIDTGWTRPAGPAERAAARRALGIPEGAGPVVAVVARLIPRKRVHLVIEATRLIPGAWVVVCGDGPLAPALRALAADRRDVTFTGEVTDPRPVYSAADVCALVSWEEGFGQVLLEAASAGVPAVVAADGGFGHRVSGWGAVAAEPTPEAVADAIRRAAGVPAARPRAWAEAHGLEAWGRRHVDLLRTVVGSAR